MSTDINAYPLQWPVGWPREDDPQYSSFKTGLVQAQRGLMNELYLLGADDIVISSNARVNSFGEIAARQKRVDDTGIAVYFTLNGEQKCIPCDKWVLLEDNIHAVELTVKALRGLDRWGAKSMVDAAFQGFAALPAGGDAGWWTVLGVERDAVVEVVSKRYRVRLMETHPDRGGDIEEYHAVQGAWEQFAAERLAK